MQNVTIWYHPKRGFLLLYLANICYHRSERKKRHKSRPEAASGRYFSRSATGFRLLLEQKFLFHGHAFRQVSRLIHIIAAQGGNMVSEQLQRHARENRHQHGQRRRNLNQIVRKFVQR